jgi:hypothetical protein
MPKEARGKAEAELKKLKLMSPMSRKPTVVRNYIDTLVGLPWKKKSKVSTDLKNSEKILDADHYGLESIKERIVEYLAVQQRVDKLKAPILCLVGPPAWARPRSGSRSRAPTNRKFVRMSLGGVRDEAEIRGHRRTYIGSMPGKILQNMTKVGVRNPLFLLDEVDKMGMDFRGDPSSALLEVLDPEQNHTFVDHYVEVEYDLSDVMFVATANTLNIPRPLLDRMEVIRPLGLHRGREGAHRQAVPAAQAVQGERHQGRRAHVTDSALRDITRYYTREAGVRGPRPRAREDLAQGREVDPHAQEGRLAPHRQLEEPRQVPGRAQVHLRHRREGEPDRPGHRPRVDRGRRRAPHGGGGEAPRQGQHRHHRQAGRGDAGVDQGRPSRWCARAPSAWASPRTSGRRSTCTSTCPRARRPRTALPPASPSPPRSSRCSRASRCAATWR